MGMKPSSYAVIYTNSFTNSSGCSQVFYDAQDRASLIRWYEAKHKFFKVVAVVENYESN